MAVGGVVAEDRYNKDIYLDTTGKAYSGSEYRQKRKAIGKKASENNLDYSSLKLYVEILNKEKDKCNGKLYIIKNNQDIRNQVKKFDESGCP